MAAATRRAAALELDSARADREVRAALAEFDEANRALMDAQHRMTEATRRLFLAREKQAPPDRGRALLTYSDAAGYLGLSLTAFRSIVQRGEIRALQFAGRGRRAMVRFDPDVLDEYRSRCAA